jgi:uncharacterized membrane protein YkoI
MTLIIKLSSVVVAACLMVGGTAFGYTGSEFAKGARINLEQARAIATKAQPGKIIDQELERETGGSGLRYSFDVKIGSVTHEIGVDAQTGEILENSVEGSHPD